MVKPNNHQRFLDAKTALNSLNALDDLISVPELEKIVNTKSSLKKTFNRYWQFLVSLFIGGGIWGGFILPLGGIHYINKALIIWLIAIVFGLLIGLLIHVIILGIKKINWKLLIVTNIGSTEPVM